MLKADLTLNAAREVTGDLYLPEGAGRHPVVVAIHGGGWRRGSRKALAQWGHFLAANGIAMLATSYRLTTSGAVWPHNLGDVAAALEWLQAQGATNGLDIGHVALMGASAGAHLAALATLTRDEAKSPPIRALVGVYGVYDLVRHWQADLIKNTPAAEDPTIRMLGATPIDNPRLYFEASPISHVTHAVRGLKVQLIHGDHDEDIEHAQSETFALRLRQGGAQVQYVTVPGAGHLWFSSEDMREPTSHCAWVAPRLLAFLKQSLK
ncbi:alpha/beta hydrolase [Asticcacaulis taihuensis]|uniref:alpha/beta hydrolase n=1 Tax=Asticcacaulis taihuensis TaxID=260084 RepID=UPI0026F1AA6C|nr:alpha/beta hydrolase [Asticcacaulis taihuensis]